MIVYGLRLQFEYLLTFICLIVISTLSFPTHIRLSYSKLEGRMLSLGFQCSWIVVAHGSGVANIYPW